MSRFLRSRRLRNLLWLLADGKCQLCGCDLPKDWHADHLIPYTATGTTDVREMQALCPECNLKKGSRTMDQLQDFRAMLAVNPEKFQPRIATCQAFQWAAQTQEFGTGLMAGLKSTGGLRKWLHLITGYGKTLIAYGMFEILRRRKIVDRLLVITPGDEQRSQFCDDEVDARNLIGANCPAQPVSKKSVDLIYNRRGERVVFVATYAQLNDGFLDDLMKSGGSSWMVVCDECHHLAEDNLWGERAEKLQATFRLYMTATYLRSDRKGLRGVPSDEASLIARADYKQAYREEAVKKVVCCNEHYKVICDSDGGRKEINAEDLRREKVENFKTYEAKRQLRYNREYLWELLFNPVAMLAQKRAAQPKDHQVIVFAMSCRHAEFICDSIRSVCDSVGYDFTCDWVGVGEGYSGGKKSDAQNSEAIERFRDGKLDILVSVDKLGEGFSIKTASILVFLNLLNADLKIFQQIGRGLRRNPRLPFQLDNVHIFAGADSEVGRLAATMEQEAKEQDEKDQPPSPPTDDSLWAIPELTVVDVDHLYREIICPVSPEDISLVLSEYDLAFCRKHDLDPYEFYKHQIGRAGFAPRGFQTVEQSARERVEAIKGQTKRATSIFCGNIIRLMKGQGHPISAETAGLVMREINTEWLRRGGPNHDAMTEDNWKQKHAWLKSENGLMTAKQEIPEWVGP